MLTPFTAIGLSTVPRNRRAAVVETVVTVLFGITVHAKSARLRVVLSSEAEDGSYAPFHAKGLALCNGHTVA